MSNLKIFNETIAGPRVQNYLQQVLGDKKGSFVNNLTALVGNNEKLQVCEPLTLMYAAIKATALDLPLDSNLGFAYVIPYKDNKKGLTEAQFQIGYKGLVQLAIRSGQFKTINVTEVRKGEIISEDLMTGELKLTRLPDREQLPVEGYVAYFSLINGFEKTLYMAVSDVEAHAKQHSQTYSSKQDYIRAASKWTTDFNAMAKKTVLKLLLSRYAPMSVQMQQAVVADQAVLHGTNNVSYVDNTPTPEEQAQTPVEPLNEEEVKAESEKIAAAALAKSKKAMAAVEAAMEESKKSAPAANVEFDDLPFDK